MAYHTYRKIDGRAGFRSRSCCRANRFLAQNIVTHAQTSRNLSEVGTLLAGVDPPADATVVQVSFAITGNLCSARLTGPTIGFGSSRKECRESRVKTGHFGRKLAKPSHMRAFPEKM